ncbi:SprT-like domain-containing protein [Halorubrum sp. Atlit-26R]|uniref:SprT-like domain-containing protein n=1 Tax=Halorubrum sp. Atlit-26R TaxID=2282128 RepID=UPI000EF19EF9|nr:SprT-like domain-containing protein [Halorubrum sp. Atlit-26R]RLM68566.1 hypothetical protein DVK07_10620 [Halorubrum sp. Atlit-26R]
MAIQAYDDAIPDLSEQTDLEEGPIKVRWSGEDRQSVKRGVRAAAADGYSEKAVAFPVLTRQKTQIVIKTEEELEAFKEELRYRAKPRVYDRITDEIETQRRSGDESEAPAYTGKAKERKENTDMDALLENEVIPHARDRVADVWPGGTVDVDEIAFFWNPQLTTHWGMAYPEGSVPRRYVDEQYRLAIGFQPAHYYRAGLESLKETCRHELIHIWQYEHPDGGTGGHGPKFKQWVDDMGTFV